MTAPDTARPIWRLTKRLATHCPEGCYMFRSEPADPRGGYHIPVSTFWGPKKEASRAR